MRKVPSIIIFLFVLIFAFQALATETASKKQCPEKKQDKKEDCQQKAEDLAIVARTQNEELKEKFLHESAAENIDKVFKTPNPIGAPAPTKKRTLPIMYGLARK
ncbi:MAG: hypothetical protein WCT18_03945 [Patescibacteria group bacterium]